MSDKKVTLKQLMERYKKGIVIPEIQRDYVMGAGGEMADGRDKLEVLLRAIERACQNDKMFDFSCIITYCGNPEKEPLEIYDGQQRLTTLFLLTIYKRRCEKGLPLDYPFVLKGRYEAEELLKKLDSRKAGLYKDTDHKGIAESFKADRVDFTTFSMVNLLEKLEEGFLKDVDSDYLLNEVKFDMVSMECQSEIEQLFMDLNAGVKMEQYELYKAKLTNHVVNLGKESSDEEMKVLLDLWAFRMDNEWLDFFDHFSDFDHPAEEYEALFLQYCIGMVCREEKAEQTENSLDHISPRMIARVFDIMENVTHLDLSGSEEDWNERDILEFSWDRVITNRTIKNNHDRRGAYWNLAYEEYERQLFYIIKKVLPEKSKRRELENDVMPWFIVTTLKWESGIREEYLRLLKILWNRCTMLNKNAWYESPDDGQYLYYCKYIVYGIPQYYGKHQGEECIEGERALENIDRAREEYDEMSAFHKWCIENIHTCGFRNREEAAIALLEQAADFEGEYVHKIVEERKNELLQNHLEYVEYLKNEKESLGITGLKNAIAELEEIVYTDKVWLYWPIRSERKSGYPDECRIMVKCIQDKLYDVYYGVRRGTERDERIEKTNCRIEDFRRLGGCASCEQLKEEGFWTVDEYGQITLHRLRDKSEHATSYNMYNSESGWEDTWEL